MPGKVAFFSSPAPACSQAGHGTQGTTTRVDSPACPASPLYRRGRVHARIRDGHPLFKQNGR